MEENRKDWVQVFGNHLILSACEPYLKLDSMKSLRATNAHICEQIGKSRMFERRAKLVVNLKSDTHEKDFLEMEDNLRVMRDPQVIHLKGDFVKLEDYGEKIIQKYGKKVETLRLEAPLEPLHVNKLVRYFLVHCSMLKRLEVQAWNLEVDPEELLTRDEYNNGVSTTNDVNGYFGLNLRTLSLQVSHTYLREALADPDPTSEANFFATTKGLVVLLLICPSVTQIEGPQLLNWRNLDYLGIQIKLLSLPFQENPRNAAVRAVRTVQVAREPITQTQILTDLNGSSAGIEARWMRLLLRNTLLRLRRIVQEEEEQRQHRQD